MIEHLRARLNAILARVDADPDAAEHDLWEVRRLLAALRPSLGEDAARLGKALDQVELRIATLRVVHVSLDLAARKRVLDRHLDAGAAAAALELLARLRRDLVESAPVLGQTPRGRLVLRELGAELDDAEARLLSGVAPALGLRAARVRVLGEALMERLNRGAGAEAVEIADELADETARLRESMPASETVANADSLLARAAAETRELRELRAVERAVDSATGSLRWLAFAVDRRRVADAIQARDNLTVAVAELRERYAAHLSARAFLADVDATLARADRELGTAIARAEADLALLRARPLLAILERGGDPQAADAAIDLEQIAAYLDARKRRAPEIGPWLRRVEAAIERERRRRRSPTSMVIGVMNDVVYGESSLIGRGAAA
ncbi:MAG TPA: hypothetical protein VKE22_25455 [Haliangiales bacterium]|nr:hypothetical protein [Haliangiales bacterium]